MLTWILIAIIVAALFGVINFDQVRHWLITNLKKYWPEIQKLLKKAQNKIEHKKKD